MSLLLAIKLKINYKSFSYENFLNYGTYICTCTCVYSSMSILVIMLIDYCIAGNFRGMIFCAQSQIFADKISCMAYNEA